MTEKHLLAINTVSGSCSVAVTKDSTVLSTKTRLADKGHSEIIISLIENVLLESELNVKQLDGFIVCTGPGNYTSLRVAISVIRGLSLACEKPACGISLFELLSTNKTKVLVLIKGPSERFYVQDFSNGFQLNLPRLMTIDQIKRTAEFMGADVIGYRAKAVSEFVGGTTYSESTGISFKKFASIGLEKLKKTCPRPSPLYIRNSE